MGNTVKVAKLCKIITDLIELSSPADSPPRPPRRTIVHAQLDSHVHVLNDLDHIIMDTCLRTSRVSCGNC